MKLRDISGDGGQFRAHLRFGLRQYCRWLYQACRLGRLGRGVHIDDDVTLSRYPHNIFVGAEAALKRGAHICSCNAGAKIRIGDRTTVGYHTFIFASTGIEIGDDCLIAPFVYIVDSNHGIERGQLINRQPNLTAPIRIGNDVWIGVGARILKGVEIGDGAVVAANAVVNSNVPSYAMVGGIPARVIGERT